MVEWLQSRRSKVTIAFWVTFLLLATVGHVAAQLPPATENQLKAAYIYNFAKFVAWPAEAFASSTAPLRICVIGRNRLQPDLDEIVAGKSIGTHPVEILRAAGPQQPSGCHILFVTRSDSEVKSALDAVRGTNVLTVGESRKFLEEGGMINFVSDGNRIRFQINLKAASRAGLKISSRLLHVAKDVLT